MKVLPTRSNDSDELLLLLDGKHWTANGIVSMSESFRQRVALFDGCWTLGAEEAIWWQRVKEQLSNTSVTMSQRFSGSEQYPQLFDAITCHIGQTVGWLSTVFNNNITHKTHHLWCHWLWQHITCTSIGVTSSLLYYLMLYNTSMANVL